MRFASSKCQSLLRELIGSETNLVLTQEQLDELDRFNYLSSCISPGFVNLIKSLLVYRIPYLHLLIWIICGVRLTSGY